VCCQCRRQVKSSQVKEESLPLVIFLLAPEIGESILVLIRNVSALPIIGPIWYFDGYPTKVGGFRRRGKGGAMSGSSGESSGRFQIRLGDLAVLVVGSAYVLDVTRRSRAGWVGNLPDLDHALGLVVLSLGVALVLIVLGQGVRRLREPRRDRWALLWRLAALAGLVWLTAEVASSLQRPEKDALPPAFSIADMRLNVIPLATSLALVGSILAVSPLRPRRRVPSLRPGWSSRLSIVLALVAAVGFIAAGYGSFPYMVLLALEAVQNALHRAPMVARPIVFDRLNLAGLEALPGLAGCLLTALWIDDDLRLAWSDPAQARTLRSWSGLLGRASTVALAVIGSGYVLVCSIPRLSPQLAEGLGAIFEPSTLATIALGFAGLSAGISARASAILADRSEPGEPIENRLAMLWVRRIVGGIACLILLESIAAAVLRIRGDFEDHWYVPFHIDAWTSSFAYPLIDRPGIYLMASLAAWLVYRLIRLFLTKKADRPASLDLIGEDRLAMGRFLGWWVGLTTLMMASLPVLGIIGVTLTHHLIRWVAN
jgi:hypothetical protein